MEKENMPVNLDSKPKDFGYLDTYSTKALTDRFWSKLKNFINQKDGLTILASVIREAGLPAHMYDEEMSEGVDTLLYYLRMNIECRSLFSPSFLNTLNQRCQNFPELQAIIGRLLAKDVSK